MASESFDNANPLVYAGPEERTISPNDLDDAVVDLIDAREVFAKIRDPEFPYTLDELRVVQEDLIKVDNDSKRIFVNFTPTVPHCGGASLIGLCIMVKLMRCLPPTYKVIVEVTPGYHNLEASLNKQLADKERVRAALEKPALLQSVNNHLVYVTK